MADLNEIEATESVKIIGASPTGLETTPVNSTVTGGLYINLRNNAGTEIGTTSNQVIIAGAGVAGTPAGGVVSVQGVAGGTALPISAASLPLPSGAATEVTLAALNAKFNSLGQKTMANSAPFVIASDQTAIPVSQSGTWNINNISGTISLPTGAATEATLSALNIKHNADFGASSGAIRVASLLGNATGAALFGAGTTTTQVLRVVLPTDQTAIPASQSGTWNINNITGTVSLPTGAATETTLAAINTKTPALGQAVMASSSPVVIASNQSAIPVSQSGTWNITNISGTVSLPTGAATEASLAKLTLTQGTTTSGQSGPLVQGAVTTAAPTYTTGQINPLSLTTTGALRVDRSGTTQPISGTITGNQGSPNTNANGWFVRLTDGTDNNLITTNGDVQVVDVSNNGGSTAAITVGTSALIANVSGAANLTNRKFLSVYNNGNVTIYWGTSNAVTTSTGTPIVKNQFVSWAVGSGTSIYLISGTASQNVRIVEMA